MAYRKPVKGTAASNIPASAMNLRREGKKGLPATGFGLNSLRMMPQMKRMISPNKSTMIKKSLVIRKSQKQTQRPFLKSCKIMGGKSDCGQK